MVRLSRIVLGTLLILLGFIGFFLPILQGWLFVGLGAMLLYHDVPYARRIAGRLETRFPRMARIVGNLKKMPLRREEKQRKSEP